jgi:hypothetical protein
MHRAQHIGQARILYFSVLVFAVLPLACGGNGSEEPKSTAGVTSTATPRRAEIRTVEYPKVDTWDELQQYISERHARIASFAQQEPNAMLPAGVTFVRGLSGQDTETLIQEYKVSLAYAQYDAGGGSGGGGAFGAGGLATLEAGQPYHDGSFLVTFLAGSAKAEDLERLTHDDRIALVYADQGIDKFTGAIPTEVLLKVPPSIYSLYRDLKPK